MIMTQASMCKVQYHHLESFQSKFIALGRIIFFPFSTRQTTIRSLHQMCLSCMRVRAFNHVFPLSRNTQNGYSVT